MSLARPRLLVVLLAGALLAACARVPVASLPEPQQGAIAERLAADIAVLASDDFAGRKPGTAGEDRTLSYLERRFAEIGLVSGTGDPGSYWRMPVALVSARALGGRITLAQGRNAVVVPDGEGAVITHRRRALAAGGPATGVPVVFVGRGAEPELPEHLAGAVLVRLGSETGEPARRARERAIAVLTVLPDAAAIAAVRAAGQSEAVMLASEEIDTLDAYVTEAMIARALGAREWERLKALSERPAFTPVEIGLAIRIEASAERREFTSSNLVGMIPGTVPDSGAVLLLAHWDHLGHCRPAEEADHICNGAIDNASGLAVMLELARRLRAGPPPGRDIYVMATTAEEAGLLGARAFAKAPPVPLASIVAAFNLDMLALGPRGSPVGFVGEGRTPLDAVIRGEIARQGRRIGDRALAESFLKRQDGWVLLEQGVPAVLLSNAYGSRERLRAFLDSAYHRPSDEAGALELGGAVEDLLLHEALVRIVADPARYSPPRAAQP
jgi:hypothetical protein